MNNNTPILIDLDRIDPNPFQTRLGEDVEHITQVANSIRAEGLFQEPIGRLVDAEGQYLNSSLVSGSFVDALKAARVQLAFGHTRWKAFQKLRTTEDYREMPVKFRHLTDLQMFEYAVRENADRHDLTAIEQARAMLVYREQFGKTSAEIGELFSLSDSAVRGKIRLLNLPESVQEHVSAGKVTEGVARSLLSAQKIIPEAIEKIAEDLAGGEFSPEAVGDKINTGLGHSKDAVLMWSKYKSGDPRGGNNLWPLTWTFDAPQEIAPAQFKKIFPGWANTESLAASIRLTYLALESGEGKEKLIDAHGLTEALVDQAIQLMQPPPCTRCAHYVKLNGQHYCGILACHRRKKAAWMLAEAHRISLELGILVYDRKTDGTDYETVSWWDTDDIAMFQAWVDENADHLRIRVKYDKYQVQPITDSKCVQIVSIRDEIRAEAAAKREEKANNQDADNARRELEQHNRDLSNAFLAEAAAPIFAAAFEGLRESILPALAKRVGEYRFQRADIPDESNERMAFYRRIIAYQVIDNLFEWNDRSQGVGHIASHLEGVAKTWGIRLPADWQDIVESFSVSTETDTPE